MLLYSDLRGCWDVSFLLEVVEHLLLKIFFLKFHSFMLLGGFLASNSLHTLGFQLKIQTKIPSRYITGFGLKVGWIAMKIFLSNLFKLKFDNGMSFWFFKLNITLSEDWTQWGIIMRVRKWKSVKQSTNSNILYYHKILTHMLNAIHFVNSVCTIFSLWKKDPPHQTFPS